MPGEWLALYSVALLFGGPTVSLMMHQHPYFRWWALFLLLSYIVVIALPLWFERYLVWTCGSGCMGIGIGWLYGTVLGVPLNLVAMIYTATRTD